MGQHWVPDGNGGFVEVSAGDDGLLAGLVVIGMMPIGALFGFWIFLYLPGFILAMVIPVYLLTFLVGLLGISVSEVMIYLVSFIVVYVINLIVAFLIPYFFWKKADTVGGILILIVSGGMIVVPILGLLATFVN